VVAMIPADSVAFALNQTTWLFVTAPQDWPSIVPSIVAGAFAELNVVVPGKFASIAVFLRSHRRQEPRPRRLLLGQRPQPHQRPE
jgi:hypothetical protein